MSVQTEIWAHRGVSAERPENTILAFDRTVELHAPGFETDVRALPDGTLLIRHDARLGTCEDASGFVDAFTGAELMQLRCDKKVPGYPDAHMPTLEALLRWLQGNSLVMNLEIKDSGFLTDVVDRSVALLNQYHMEKRCVISSFNHTFLQRVKAIAPQYQTGALYSESGRRDMAAYCKANGIDSLHPHQMDLTAEKVRHYHENGLPVRAWGVEKEEDVRRLIEYGVDVLILNDVAAAQRILDETTRA